MFIKPERFGSLCLPSQFLLILRGTSSLFVATSAGYLVSMAVTPAITRLYNPEIFGRYAATIAMISILALISSMKFDLAVLVATEGDLRPLLRTSLVIAMTVSFAASLVNAIANWGSGASSSVIYSLVVGLLIFVTAVSGLSDALLTRRQHYARLAKRKFAQPAVLSIGQLLLHGLQQLGLMLGAVLGRSIGLLIVLRSVREYPPSGKKLGIDVVDVTKRYWKCPVVYLPSLLLKTIPLQFPVVVVSMRHGNSVAGQYSVALVVAMALPALLTSSVTSPLSGEFAARVRASNFLQRSLYLQSTLGLLALAVPIGLLLAVALPPVVIPVFGSEWKQVRDFIPPLSLLACTSICLTPQGCVFAIYERQIWYAISSVIAVAGFVVAVALAISFSLSAISLIMAITFSHVISHIATWAMGLYIVSKNYTT